jgi:transposase
MREQRSHEQGWDEASPKLVLRKRSAELHFPQEKTIEAKQDPDLVTVGVDLNVKTLAVITVRQHEKISETVFVTDHGLDQARYRHLKKISKKHYLSGKPVKGAQSNQHLWAQVRRMNESAARHLWPA